MLTNTQLLETAVTDVKFRKGTGPNAIPKRALKHLQQKAISFLVHIFNTIFLTYHIPRVCNYARLISILNRGRIYHSPRSIETLVLWARLVNYF
jgi:hypothetical protein